MLGTRGRHQTDTQILGGFSGFYRVHLLAVPGVGTPGVGTFSSWYKYWYLPYITMPGLYTRYLPYQTV